MIETLQQELVDISALKAGVVWREKGKKSAKYLKAIHKNRTAQQYMSGIQVPSSNSDNPPTVSDDTDQMKTSAHQFYQHLYDAEPVWDDAIKDYLDDIQLTKTLDSNDAATLVKPFTINELIDQASRLTKQSSPGADGLSYPYLAILFQIPMLERLVTDLYNQALDGVFPTLWQDIRVRLLPKKGDLSLLKNWLRNSRDKATN
ncbi:hypothetical protein INT47_002381 [Mucor saturninus]|uniref:Reverse transcriptase n=1 Tax=Mucor saturninus TaxID=64648 RepID=A0A8H7RGA2_9FUNG|nr:hypothetical protein INT47_002381 [Mucor saturninus]